MAVTPKPKLKRRLHYKAADLTECILVQQRVLKILQSKSLLFPKGVPKDRLSAWTQTTTGTTTAYLLDHRNKAHRCPPPLWARVIELEYERRMLA